MPPASQRYATSARVTNVKVSVRIPDKDRLDNLRIALEALTRQTMRARHFEVIIGATGYSTELIAATSVFCDRLDIVTVSSSREFHTASIFGTGGTRPRTGSPGRRITPASGPGRSGRVSRHVVVEDDHVVDDDES